MAEEIKRRKEIKIIDFRGKKVQAQRYIAIDRTQSEHDDDLWIVTEKAKEEVGL